MGREDPGFVVSKWVHEITSEIFVLLHEMKSEFICFAARNRVGNPVIAARMQGGFLRTQLHEITSDFAESALCNPHNGRRICTKIHRNFRNTARNGIGVFHDLHESKTDFLPCVHEIKSEFARIAVKLPARSRIGVFTILFPRTSRTKSGMDRYEKEHDFTAKLRIPTCFGAGQGGAGDASTVCLLCRRGQRTSRRSAKYTLAGLRMVSNASRQKAKKIPVQPGRGSKK